MQVPDPETELPPATAARPVFTSATRRPRPGKGSAHLQLDQAAAPEFIEKQAGGFEVGDHGKAAQLVLLQKALQHDERPGCLECTENGTEAPCQLERSGTFSRRMLNSRRHLLPCRSSTVCPQGR